MGGHQSRNEAIRPAAGFVASRKGFQLMNATVCSLLASGKLRDNVVWVGETRQLGFIIHLVLCSWQGPLG